MMSVRIGLVAFLAAVLVAVPGATAAQDVTVSHLAGNITPGKFNEGTYTFPGDVFIGSGDAGLFATPTQLFISDPDSSSDGLSIRNDALTTSKDVGIGTPTPSGDLNIRVETGKGLVLNDSSDGDVVAHLREVQAGNPSEGVLGLMDDGTVNVRLRGGDNQDSYFNGDDIGIGTTNPRSPLHLSASDNQLLNLTSGSSGTWIDFVNTQNSGNSIYSIGHEGGANEFSIYDRTAGSYRLTVKSNGDISVHGNNLDNIGGLYSDDSSTNFFGGCSNGEYIEDISASGGITCASDSGHSGHDLHSVDGVSNDGGDVDFRSSSAISISSSDSNNYIDVGMSDDSADCGTDEALNSFDLGGNNQNCISLTSGTDSDTDSEDQQLGIDTSGTDDTISITDGAGSNVNSVTIDDDYQDGDTSSTNELDDTNDGYIGNNPGSAHSAGNNLDMNDNTIYDNTDEVDINDDVRISSSSSPGLKIIDSDSATEVDFFPRPSNNEFIIRGGLDEELVLDPGNEPGTVKMSTGDITDNHYFQLAFADTDSNEPAGGDCDAGGEIGKMMVGRHPTENRDVLYVCLRGNSATVPSWRVIG